ncbi:MAG: RIP metalloprotease RseP [Deltaproteobacteria bacterium]
MVTVVSFIIVLGILIFIHEVGHFAVAKYSGVGVEKFSLGFGPRLIGVRYGETEYRLSLLPLGGYVKMVGEAQGEDVTEQDLSRSFNHKGVLTRSLIVASGPFMNLILAALLFPLIYMIGVQAPAFLEQSPKVGFVSPESPAYSAGMRRGDMIESVNGKPVKNWEEYLSASSLYHDRDVDMGVSRANAAFTVTLKASHEKTEKAGYSGLYPEMEPVIGELSAGYPAKEAGIHGGDRIISVDGASIVHWAELEEVIRRDGKKKIFVVERNGENLTIEVAPKYNDELKAYLVGITRRESYVRKSYGFVESVEKGASTSIAMTGQLFLVIKGLVTGEYSLKALGGPIMIAKVAGKAAKTGVAELLALVAFLSLQLGIINLFPIPVLDGGHLLFFCIESIKGSPLSERFLSVAQQVGMVFLIGLMVLVTYNDLFRIFE